MTNSATYHNYHKEIHTFDESQHTGYVGEVIIDHFLTTVLGWQVIYVPTKTEELARKFDRIYLNPRTDKTFIVEEKYDKGGDVSPNICLEIYSNRQSRRKGWMLQSDATHYVVLIRSTIHIMSMPELQQWYQDHMAEYFGACRYIPNTDNNGRKYESTVIIPPKKKVFSQLKLHKEYDAKPIMEMYNRGELNTGPLIEGNITPGELHREPGKGLIKNIILNTKFKEQ